MDTFSKEKRSEIMSCIHSKDTKPERLVKKLLWANGFRYARTPYGLPGTPDVILPRHKAVIFVHGCFWHGHTCPKGRLPATNQEYWSQKMEGNKKRDAQAVRALRKLGWSCLIIWECQLAHDLERAIKRLKNADRGNP